jgi:hypothetical protein
VSIYSHSARNAGPKDPKRPMNGTLAALLLLEAIVVALSVPVMISVANVPVQEALGAGLGVAVLAAVGSGLQTRRGGRVVGGLVQAGAIALGVLTPVMVFLGVLFAACWFGFMLLEDRIRRIRREKGLDRPTQ